MPDIQNNTSRWARWAIGLFVLILVGVLTGLATGVIVNGRGVAENAANIRTFGPRLERIEAKQDRLLELYTERGK